MARADGAHTHFNRRWLEFTGLSHDASLGEGWLHAFHPDDHARTLARWQQAIATGEPYEIEYRLRRADGTYHWMLGRAIPLRDITGTIVRWFGTCTDIDEMKRAQSRIAEQAALLDQTQDAIIVRDLQHRIVYWNKGAEHLYGWTAEEVSGRSINDLLYRDLGQLTNATESLVRHGQWSGELRHFTKAGREVTIESRWRLLRDAHGHPTSVLAVNTDVTERKLIEAQFLRAQRVESIGTLAGGIAHDLNNLLSPIVMSVGLLREGALTPADRKLVDAIETSANRGTELVKQVLSFARGVEGARIPVLPGHLVREIESLVRNTFPKNITFSAEIAPGTHYVHGDPTQLNQVLLNLCVNARDAMPGGGRITVRAGNTEIDASCADAHPSLALGSYVELEVSDTGCGIPREVIDRIFEPFFTTKEPGKGTGLGLSTVLGIVRSHGGSVQVNSEPGRGTTFRILLPAQRGAAPVAPRDHGAPQYPQGRGQTVLVVDDDAMVLSVTRQTLSTYNYRVLAAEDGAQAMAVFATERDRIELVLTDLMMPVMDGLALIAAIHRLKPDTRIVAMTGLQDNVNGARIMKAGIEHVLAKPYTGADLLQLVARVLAEPAGRAPAD
ncbi:PAS domain S-box protein [Oleiharenicola sp. Vm1]|uniref:hybrid sensor histidine kinase/response regulator n=1 Tax=Oleiharenicola sp. Vm1 TaxID=3398393 RepID=UPI0039F498A6